MGFFYFLIVLFIVFPCKGDDRIKRTERLLEFVRSDKDSYVHPNIVILKKGEDHVGLKSTGEILAGDLLFRLPRKFMFNLDDARHDEEFGNIFRAVDYEEFSHLEDAIFLLFSMLELYIRKEKSKFSPYFEQLPKKQLEIFENVEENIDLLDKYGSSVAHVLREFVSEMKRDVYMAKALVKDDQRMFKLFNDQELMMDDEKWFEIIQQIYSRRFGFEPWSTIIYVLGLADTNTNKECHIAGLKVGPDGSRDVLVFARKDVKKGEEIFVRYHIDSPTHWFLKLYGFFLENNTNDQILLDKDTLWSWNSASDLPFQYDEDQKRVYGLFTERMEYFEKNDLDGEDQSSEVVKFLQFERRQIRKGHKLLKFFHQRFQPRKRNSGLRVFVEGNEL